MNKALVFSKDSELYGKVVSAQEIENGYVSRKLEFVDVEYEFKVLFVKRGVNGKTEHFRLYLSQQDYKRMTDEQKNKYEIISKMRHYQESVWHRHWEDNFLEFEKEKVIRDLGSGKRKRADVYISSTRTCVEFQHSFIAADFKDRTEFYDRLGFNVIWLYDLTSQNVERRIDGSYEILEDNSKGFSRLRISRETLKSTQFSYK